MLKEPTKPSESLVQDLLAERRDLKVALERVRLELDEMRRSSGGPDPRVSGLTAEVERLRYQVAHARAEASLLREERDELRHGVEKVLEQIGRK